jgi:glyoxylase-like metal-dependent hydrolase (beta-lactamase superfamily II)
MKIMHPDVRAFFDEATFTVTYVVREPDGVHCVIVDSVLDYDPKSGRTRTNSADAVLEHVREHELQVDWILETHAHADHLTAAPYLQEALGAPIAIGEHIKDVQGIFAKVFNAGPSFATDGSQFDHLFVDGEEFVVGSMTGRVMHTPGHTPACLTYVFGDAAFVGDTLFMPDYGTARADFPGGDAATLYRSIKKVLALPPATRLFMCHDYKAPNRDEYAWETTVAEESRHNIHVHDGVTEAEFVELRNARDKTLAMPVLILPSVQINMRAGRLPPPEDNGITYLKIPVDAL